MKPEELWRSMRLLLDRVSALFEKETLVDECLDILVELLGADRGFIILTEPGSPPEIVHARKARRPMSAAERETISKTLVRRAVETGTCVVWDVHNVDIDSESLSVLPVSGAFAAPLPSRAGSPARGVAYVDWRDLDRVGDEGHVELFVAAVVLIGAVLEQHRIAQATRDELREAKGHYAEARRRPRLDALLALEGLAELRDEVEIALRTDAPILILGESGTGKTLLAQAIAEAGGRTPVVRVFLGGSDDLNTIASELFGHERGAFSGATQRRVGLVEFATGGTLILDELLNLPPHAQRLLLDFTQFGSYRPLGYAKPEPKRSNVRLIGATSGDLAAAMRDGRFRADLYYRLAATILRMPSLRERRRDVPALAEATLASLGTPAMQLTSDARAWLLSPSHEWLGNIRQLELLVQHARERALISDPRARELAARHLEAAGGKSPPRPAEPPPPKDGDPEPLPSRWSRLQSARAGFEEAERALILEALELHAGVVAHAARELSMARSTLKSKIAALGIERSEST